MSEGGAVEAGAGAEFQDNPGLNAHVVSFRNKGMQGVFWLGRSVFGRFGMNLLLRRRAIAVR